MRTGLGVNILTLAEVFLSIFIRAKQLFTQGRWWRLKLNAGVADDDAKPLSAVNHQNEKILAALIRFPSCFCWCNFISHGQQSRPTKLAGDGDGDARLLEKYSAGIRPPPSVLRISLLVVDH